MADELPKLFSDEEFDAQLELRELSSTQLRRRPSDGLPESTLEQRFPHIVQRLTAIWWSDVCSVYLNNLMISDRPDRQGFPYDVLEDLIMLSEINSSLINPAHPAGNSSARDPFGWARQRRAAATSARPGSQGESWTRRVAGFNSA
jgi:hypothetical protein